MAKSERAKRKHQEQRNRKREEAKQRAVFVGREEGRVRARPWSRSLRMDTCGWLRRRLLRPTDTPGTYGLTKEAQDCLEWYR